MFLQSNSKCSVLKCLQASVSFSFNCFSLFFIVACASSHKGSSRVSSLCPIVPRALIPRAEKIYAKNSRPYFIKGRQYFPMDGLYPFRQAGLASWYGVSHHGKITASGEKYDMCALSAAHPTLPIPSYVRVTRIDIEPPISVIVRINDRGPFVPGRVIDLSVSAAGLLNSFESGIALVTVDLLLP